MSCVTPGEAARRVAGPPHTSGTAPVPFADFVSTAKTVGLEHDSAGS